MEQVELTRPWKAVQDTGGTPVLLAPERGSVQAVTEVDVADFADLVLPGGVANPDKLRVVPDAVAFARGFAEAGKPIAAICHGPRSLVEAGVLTGKTLTSWPSLRTDITNAGGQWLDEQLFTSRRQGCTLATSRKPDDLDAFGTALVEALAAA